MSKGLIFISIFIVTTGILLGYLSTPGLSFYRMFEAKDKLLISTLGPRVITVGGSNVIFGQDSERLSLLLGKAVIDDGLAAPFGMRVTLNNLAPYVHSGDIVVISPEYLNFFDDGLEGDNYYLALLLDAFPKAVGSFELPQYIRLPDIYIMMVRGKFQALFTNSSKTPQAEFNRFGDQIIPPGTVNSPNIPSDSFISDNQVFNPAAVGVFNRFARQVKAKGAMVVMVYPSARMTNCWTTENSFKQLDTTLRNHLEFPILDHPFDSCFADNLFFNTYYHLDNDGRELRTQQLAELLIDQGVVKVGLGIISPGK